MNAVNRFRQRDRKGDGNRERERERERKSDGSLSEHFIRSCSFGSIAHVDSADGEGGLQQEEGGGRRGGGGGGGSVGRENCAK